MSPAVSLRDLTKRYGETLGVEGISFDVQPGEIVGFLGPNGSGKTTVLRMIVGLISITRGSAEVFGRDVATGGPGVREKVGYLPEALSLYEHMTAGEYLGFISRMRRRDCGAIRPGQPQAGRPAGADGARWPERQSVRTGSH